jgi:protein-L-isoaspartate(D-aspartate) O-methyltransferase
VPAPDDNGFAGMRRNMVTYQIEARGVHAENVLAAMRHVPRHLFLPESLRWAAYDDTPVSIGRGQTISQPYIVARMTELLELDPDSTVLEIGTGSGYQAAVLAEIAHEVWTIERYGDLAREAERLLEGLGYQNVHVIVGDGTLGCAEAAPFDAIIVTAAAPHVPTALAEQLSEGGRLVIPVGDTSVQELRQYRKQGDAFKEARVLDCRFVPLVGRDAFGESRDGTP